MPIKKSFNSNISNKNNNLNIILDRTIFKYINNPCDETENCLLAVLETLNDMQNYNIDLKNTFLLYYLYNESNITIHSFKTKRYLITLFYHVFCKTVSMHKIDMSKEIDKIVSLIENTSNYLSPI